MQSIVCMSISTWACRKDMERVWRLDALAATSPPEWPYVFIKIHQDEGTEFCPPEHSIPKETSRPVSRVDTIQRPDLSRQENHGLGEARSCATNPEYKTLNLQSETEVNPLNPKPQLTFNLYPLLSMKRQTPKKRKNKKNLMILMIPQITTREEQRNQQ